MYARAILERDIEAMTRAGEYFKARVDQLAIFRSRQTDCATCPMKAKCCPNTAFRKIARSVHEAARDVARRIAATPAYQRSRHERKKVEMLFAHLKRILKLDRLRLRGMSGATDEFTLAAAVQNLRRLAKFSSQGPPVTG